MPSSGIGGFATRPFPKRPEAAHRPEGLGRFDPLQAHWRHSWAAAVERRGQASWPGALGRRGGPVQRQARPAPQVDEPESGRADEFGQERAGRLSLASGTPFRRGAAVGVVALVPARVQCAWRGAPPGVAAPCHRAWPCRVVRQ
eukprot:6848875-Pyramimonas_sp.AAC.1